MTYLKTDYFSRFIKLFQSIDKIYKGYVFKFLIIIKYLV